MIAMMRNTCVKTHRTTFAGAARSAGALAIAVVVAFASIAGCDANPTGQGGSSSAEPPIVPPEKPPTLEFPNDLRRDYPEAAVFLDEFLNTCLAGDYQGYRRLVSRAFTPESRERFEAIYHAVEGIAIESIQQIKIPHISDEVYLVVTAVDLDPKRHVKLRETHRKIGILVFPEAGAWRMAPAPPELQPKLVAPPTTQPTTTSAPAASQPAFPWDEDGDY